MDNSVNKQLRVSTSSTAEETSDGVLTLKKCIPYDNYDIFEKADSKLLKKGPVYKATVHS